MTTLLLAAVGGSGRQTGVALPADHLVAVVFGGKGLEGGFDDAASETEDQVEGGFLYSENVKTQFIRFLQDRNFVYLLDVVIAQSTTIFELLAREDQPLLIWWNSFLVLDLGFDIVDCVGGLDLKSDGLAREGLDEAVIPFPSVYHSPTLCNFGVAPAEDFDVPGAEHGGSETYICTGKKSVNSTTQVQGSLQLTLDNIFWSLGSLVMMSRGAARTTFGL